MFLRKAGDQGIVAWDCIAEEEVLLCPYGLLWAGDNPMQAEECSQAGLACNHFCNKCWVGGTKKYKRSDEGYLTLFMVSFCILYHKTCSTIELIRMELLGGLTRQGQKSKSS